MELRDYGTALRRYWTTWLGVALTGLLLALVVVLVTPPTYQATAQVFVASVDGGTSGSQFVNQRVTSYPQVADSRTVLAPVMDDLDLTESFADLRKRVSATNPVDTSQIEIVVTDGDAGRAAQIANAVAERFGTAVEELEQPGVGASPVSLTVTNPATVPASPISPVPTLLLPLGLVVGLALGAAAAVVRSRLDTRLHGPDDVRAAWGPGAEQLVVHAAPGGHLRRSRSAHRPTTSLARQLEPMAEHAPVRVLVMSPAPDRTEAAQAVVDEVAAELTAWEVPVLDADAPAGDRPGVQLRLGSPQSSPREWRRATAEHAGVVLVVEPGRVDRADLAELRSILDAAGVPVLAVVVPVPERRPGRRSPAVPATTEPRTTPAAAAVPAPARPVEPKAPAARGAVPAGRR
ncbi:YveK family protein [Modestobacter versicolor]|uniref:YveK family protein n=1 Tax=Modestobacter versicolor TaxID=429133 RepID=UPI0034DE0C11